MAVDEGEGSFRVDDTDKRTISMTYDYETGELKTASTHLEKNCYDKYTESKMVDVEDFYDKRGFENELRERDLII